MAVVSVLLCIWRSRGRPVLAGDRRHGSVLPRDLGGSPRFSGTISVDFGPSRVEAQAYLLFVAIAAVGLEQLASVRATRSPTPERGVDPKRPARRRCVVAALSVSTASELSNLADPGAQPPAELSATGQQADGCSRPMTSSRPGWLAVRPLEPLDHPVRPLRFVRAGRLRVQHATELLRRRGPRDRRQPGVAPRGPDEHRRPGRVPVEWQSERHGVQLPPAVLRLDAVRAVHLAD